MKEKKSHWKVLSKKKIFDNFWQRISSWKVRVPDGSVHDYTFSGSKDFVFVFVVTTDAKVVILTQYHINLESYHTTLVAGYIDKGERARSTVKREVLEETGYAVNKITQLGWGIRGKWSLGKGYYFLAEGAERVKDQKLEAAEDITVREMSFEGVKKLLHARAFVDAHAESCVWRALSYLQKI